MTNLFQRVSRYGASSPENRLTQVFAGVLERVSGLAFHLATSWLSQGAASAERGAPEGSDAARALEELTRSGPATPVVVRTQVPTRSGRFVDLELAFGAADRRVTLWVEIKHAALLHESQLANYLEDRPSGALVFLAPRRTLRVEQDVPDAVPMRAWEETGRLILHHARAGDMNPVERYLAEEFYAFMTEEALNEPEVIRPEHLVAFAIADEAERALIRICEDVSSAVRARIRREPLDYGKAAGTRTGAADYSYGYWETFELPVRVDGLPQEAVFDWNAYFDRSHPASAGSDLFFLAGLAIDAGGSFASTDEIWRGRLTGGISLENGVVIRFEQFSDEWHERYARATRPEEVLIGRTLSEQAASLARWVTDTYDALGRSVDQPPQA